jgi:hypothetical protein
MNANLVSTGTIVVPSWFTHDGQKFQWGQRFRFGFQFGIGCGQDPCIVWAGEAERVLVAGSVLWLDLGVREAQKGRIRASDELEVVEYVSSGSRYCALF